MTRSAGDQGYTLIELLVVIIVASIVASLAIPAALRARRNARIAECSRGLSRMWQEMKDHSAKAGAYPAETGPAFWLKLAPSPGFTCPVKGGSPAGGCDYRGPALPWPKIGESDIVGADAEFNHSGGPPSVGGTVLRKGGEVQVVGDFDAIWEQAGHQTK